MVAHAHQFPLRLLAHVLGVSRSGYYQWRRRAPSPRTRETPQLWRAIDRVWRASHGCYGAPRIHQQLRAEGWAVSRPRVARLMRQHGIASQIRKRWVVTTQTQHALPVAPNLVGRDFQSDRLSAVWVSDITYLRTADGWTYLTIIMDLADRQIIGWAFSRGLDARHTSVPAWEIARTRRPIQQPLIFHADRGIQYACEAFTQCLATHPTVRQSMSRRGQCGDNAAAESFCKTLKAERMVDLRQLHSRQASQVIFHFIEIWYNRQRLHSTLGYQTPAAKEQQLTLAQGEHR